MHVSMSVTLITCTIIMYIYFYVENLIDGKEFVALQENEVKDLIPPLGIVKKILRLIPAKDKVA